MTLYNVLLLASSSTYATSPERAQEQALEALDCVSDLAVMEEKAAALAVPVVRTGTQAIIVRGQFEFIFPAEAVDDDQQTAMNTARAIIEALGGRVLLREEAS